MIKRLIFAVILVVGGASGLFIGFFARNDLFVISGVGFLLAAVLVLLRRITACLIVATVAAVIVAWQIL